MWPQSILILIGVWLMASPDVMGYGGSARANNQIVGVWMATFGMIAMSECTRAMRWVNLVLGTWLVMAPFWAGLSRRTCIRQYRFGCRFGIAGPRAKPNFRTIRGRVVGTLERKLNHERRPLGERYNAC
ncbi:MAG: SPW repeat domain-containing protein [Nitrospira sp.]